MTDDLPDRNSFEAAYRQLPPWDIGRPQAAILSIADQVSGRVLDIGCGTGENALYFAKKGHSVLGIDYLSQPIEMAKEKLKTRQLKAGGTLQIDFQQGDALQVNQLEERFDTIIDCGLFHVFSDTDRTTYIEGLSKVLRPNGLLVIHCFSDKEPPGFGPRRINIEELRGAFSQHWKIESIDNARYEIRPDFDKYQFSEGGAHAWLMTARRIAP